MGLFKGNFLYWFTVLIYSRALNGALIEHFFCQQAKSPILQKEYAMLLFWKELTAGSSLFFCIPSAPVTEQLD